MAYSFRSNVSPAEFDAFVRQSPLTNIMQESRWAKVKDEWAPIYCGVYEDNTLKACALLLCRPLMLGYLFGYVPRGPVMDFNDQPLVDFMMESLYRLGKSMRLVSIKFDPNIYQTYAIDQTELAKKARMDDIVLRLTRYPYCRHRGYNEDMYAATQPRHQLCFYRQDDIWSALPKKTREKIEIAHASHVEIEQRDVSSVKEFHDMITYTEKRKGIVLRNTEYFTKMMEAYDEEQAVFFFAYLNHDLLIKDLQDKHGKLSEEMKSLDEKAHKKKAVLEKQIAKVAKDLDIAIRDRETDGSRVLVSALLLVRDDKTTELLYSGLNGHYRQYYAPYALRYRAMQWAFEHGCQRFNFGGVQGSLDDGLFTFKSSFHPCIDVYIGEFDIVIKPMLYHVIETLIPKIKQWKLRMARKGKRNAS